MTDVFDVYYSTGRLARVAATDMETAKRRFAAFVLYDDVAHVRSDVRLTDAGDAEVSPSFGAVPTRGTREEMRAWLARSEAAAEPFEVGLFEDPERRIDTYLRLLATNDPWRLEGHGSLGRTLSAVALHADLLTFDGRIRYRFEPTQFVDYLAYESIASLDPERPHESFNIANLVDVAALHDEGLRQIASSYETIATERRLTARFAGAARETFAPYAVTIDREDWLAYADHRAKDPQRFLPPAGWRSAHVSDM